MRVLAALPNCRDASFRGWLFTIAHHAAIDAERSRRPSAPLASADDLVDPRPTPEEAAVASAAGQVLRDLFGKLSSDQRQVVELHLAGLSGREIAEILGRSHDAIRAIQARAVARLRTLLQAEPRETSDG
jgi:RNA polymerase sigma-70 factor (ECF subfamily)